MGELQSESGFRQSETSHYAFFLCIGKDFATFSAFHFQYIAYAGEDDSFITNPHIISNSDMAVHLLTPFIEMLSGLFANFSMTPLTPLILLSLWSIIFIEWKILFSMS